VLLRERVWKLQERGLDLPPTARMRYADSALSSHTTHRLLHEMVLSEEDKLATIDLRPFMDPSPYVVNELMPLRRVYRLFNEIGVRHLAVVDCREQVVGILTRKDILPHSIKHKLLHEEEVKKAEKLLEIERNDKRRSSAVMSALVKMTGMSTKDVVSLAAPQNAGRRSHAPPSDGEASPMSDKASPGELRRSVGTNGSRRGVDGDGGAGESTVVLQSGDDVVQTNPKQRRSFLSLPSPLRKSEQERHSAASCRDSFDSCRSRTVSEDQGSIPDSSPRVRKSASY